MRPPVVNQKLEAEKRTRTSHMQRDDPSETKQYTHNQSVSHVECTGLFSVPQSFICILFDCVGTDGWHLGESIFNLDVISIG